jgi:2-keto-4-pentenoate hydratase
MTNFHGVQLSDRAAAAVVAHPDGLVAAAAALAAAAAAAARPLSRGPFSVAAALADARTVQARLLLHL